MSELSRTFFAPTPNETEVGALFYTSWLGLDSSTQTRMHSLRSQSSQSLSPWRLWRSINFIALGFGQGRRKSVLASRSSFSFCLAVGVPSARQSPHATARRHHRGVTRIGMPPGMTVVMKPNSIGGSALTGASW